MSPYERRGPGGPLPGIANADVSELKRPPCSKRLATPGGRVEIPAGMAAVRGWVACLEMSGKKR